MRLKLIRAALTGSDPVRAALAGLIIMASNELDTPDLWVHSRSAWDDAIANAEQALADEPAVPEDGREPAAVITEPSDPELADAYWKAWHGHNGRTLSASHYAGLRAVLARWGNLKASLTSSPPADGEVAELVADLRSTAKGLKSQSYPQTAELITRAAELLEQQALVPVSVSERLPEPNTKVLAHYFNALGHGRTICAIWVPAKSRSDEIGDDDFTEYDEEDDTFYWPEGWYEAIENWDDLGWVYVDEGEVVYWQPLPKWPAHALPLPGVNNG